MIIQIGDDEECIKKYLQEKLMQTANNIQEKHIPINKMFEYGTTRNCIHFHLQEQDQEERQKKKIWNWKKNFLQTGRNVQNTIC